jgi:subtilisin family serine protease
MDPNLVELFEAGSPDDEVSVILRLETGAAPPTQVRVVSQFGEVATARVRRGDIAAVRRSPAVKSLKASRYVTPPSPLEPGFDPDAYGDEAESEPEAGPAMPEASHLPPVTEDGRGVVVGICDWGIDFTHANFRNADGSTRLLAIWDQRGFGDPRAPAPYNLGRLLTREAINAALAEPDPCAARGYHPASGDPSDSGSHGTHVADILAGNRREPGSEVGLASGADLVFVHLAAPHLSELANLGDSVGLLEGLDFIRRQAAGRPCVLHLSAGKTGGPHRGTTLLERAVDAMLAEPGIALVQSVGNYADAAMHTHARVGPDQKHVLDWLIPRDDRTSNELEIWYNGQDVFDVTLIAPHGREFSVALGSRAQLRDGAQVWGNFYHRRHEPNSGLNHVCVFLYTTAPGGRWRLVLHGRDVVDGRLHAWIERDASGRYQSRFPRSQASSRYTTNTICNCFRAIAVGAYDGTRPDRPPTRFSSRGPTADGRQKPEIAAPGYRIRAARSLPRGGWQGEPRLTVKSGTSMAAPWVSGTVALMMAAAGRPLTIHEIRRALIGTADPHPGPSGRSSTQLGYGYLNVAAAVEAARRIGRGEPPPRLPADRPREDIEALEELEPDERGWAPIWVEDAAAGTAEGGLLFPAPEAEAEDLPGPHPALPAETCGCGHRGEAEARDIPGEEGEEGGDQEWEEEIDEEQIAIPIAWEDVQDALEAVDELDR